MQFSQLACPVCAYNCNALNAKKCELCGNSVDRRTSAKTSPRSARQTKTSDRPQPAKASLAEGSEASPVVVAKNRNLYRNDNSSHRSTSGGLTIPKDRLAKTLLIVTGILLGASVTTIVFNFDDFRLPLIARQENLNLSKYSDIKLYEVMEEVPDVPEGLFSYGGALCFAAIKRDGMNAAISNAHEQFRLRYVEPQYGNPGCTTGIKMLLNRELSIAQNSRPLTIQEVNTATSRGYELDSVPVAIDGIVFYTNKSLGIKSLSLNQLRDIYSGKITNWRELGGKDLPITPVSLDPRIDSILQLLMETENPPWVGNNVAIVRDYTTAIRKTASTPGAISYGSSALIKGQDSIAPIALAANDSSTPVSALLADGTVNLQAFEENFYPLTRRLFVVIRRDGTPEEKAGVAYTNLLLSEEGQKIFQQAGFVPLYFQSDSRIN